MVWSALVQYLPSSVCGPHYSQIDNAARNRRSDITTSTSSCISLSISPPEACAMRSRVQRTIAIVEVFVGSRREAGDEAAAAQMEQQAAGLTREIEVAAAQFAQCGFYLRTREEGASSKLGAPTAAAGEAQVMQCPSLFALSSLQAEPIWTTLMDKERRVLEARAETILEEYREASKRGVLTKEKIQRDVEEGGMWEAEYLLREGEWQQAAVAAFPELCGALRELSVMSTCGLGYVYFSTLHPGTVIRRHCGPTNLKIRAQLTLVSGRAAAAAVHGGSTEGGYLEVAGQRLPFEAGQAQIFDDSFLHSAVLPASASEARLVLIVDLWHPGLGAAGVEQLSRANLFPVLPAAAEDVKEAVSGQATSAQALRCRCVRAADVLPSDDGSGAPAPQDIVLLKFLLTGDAGVGKTSLLLRFTEDTFSSQYSTSIGVDFKIRIERYRDPDSGGVRSVKLQLWDTAGPERFRTITKSYYRGASGIFICYDVSDRSSFERVANWADQVDQNATAGTCCVLVGLQADASPMRPREVSAEEAAEFAVRRGLPFLECSSKDSRHVRDVFATMVFHVMRTKEFDATKPQRAQQPAPPLTRERKQCVML